MPKEKEMSDQAKQRQAEAARRAKMFQKFDQLSPDVQARILVIMEILESDRPELLEIMTPPIEIIKDTDLTESDSEVIEIDPNTPP